MKNQFALLGIFLILIGILIFVYWILLPIPEKEKILRDIYGPENNSEIINYNKDISISVEKSLVIDNIYLHSGRKELIISENYTIGEFVGFYEIDLGNVFIKTNIFSGVKDKKLYFSYQESEGAVISFISRCENGKMEILINNVKVFEGCANDLQTFFIQREYLNKNNNFILIKFYPKSIVSDSILEIRNFKIIFVKRNELSFDYFYTGSEEVYLVYNFCPTDPNVLELYINNKKVSLYSCYHNMFDITRYLNRGKNIISLKAKAKTKINLKIITTSNIYTQIINLTKKDYMLYVIKSRGSGEIYINSCKFYLDAFKDVFSFVVTENCINSGDNVIIIRPDLFMEIDSIIIK